MVHERDEADPADRAVLRAFPPARRTAASAAGGESGVAQAAGAARDELRSDGLRIDDRKGRDTLISVDAVAPTALARQSRRRLGPALIAGGALIAALAAAGYLYLDDAAHWQTTDDAFFAARQSSIAPKVGGFVTEVPVTDNEHVKAGDLIARIDPRDYQVAVRQAEAQVAAAQAGVKAIDAQISAQAAQIAAAGAQRDQAQAALVFAEQQADRYERLVQTGAGAVINAQQTSSQLNQQRAAVEAAEAQRTLAERQLETLNAQRATAEANLKLAEAQADQARLNLSYTEVRAAEPGRVANLNAAVGALAQPGASLATFVPDAIWVTANFKETQLDAMRPGEPVTISIDAYPDRALTGRVASVQPGSGTAFSLLPAENATGNYVKIVQRVPVKIVIDNLPHDVALGPGVSVVPSVRINPAPSLYERLSAEVARLKGRA